MRTGLVTARPLTATAIVGVTVAAAVTLAAVLLTRDNTAQAQKRALAADVSAALASSVSFDQWSATTARSTAFQHPADGSTRRLYAAWHTTSTRTAAIDLTLTDGTFLCLISTTDAATTTSHVTQTWQTGPCSQANEVSAPTPTALRPTPPGTATNQ